MRGTEGELPAGRKLDGAGRMAGHWVDVREAARELGISTDAVRKQIARGSLESNGPDNNLLVWLDDGRMKAGREAQVDGGATVEKLREQVHYLRSILNEEGESRRRADTILAQLTRANAALAARAPELEAPREPPGAHESTADEQQGQRGPTPDAGGALEAAEHMEDRRGFWSRLFGSNG
jgi:hypothetical protein